MADRDTEDTRNRLSYFYNRVGSRVAGGAKRELFGVLARESFAQFDPEVRRGIDELIDSYMKGRTQDGTEPGATMGNL